MYGLLVDYFPNAVHRITQNWGLTLQEPLNVFDRNSAFRAIGANITSSARPQRKSKSKQQRRRRFQLERLEDRRLLAADLSSLNDYPLAFEASAVASNQFHARGGGYNLTLSANQISLALSGPIDVYAEGISEPDPSVAPPLSAAAEEALAPEYRLLGLELLGANPLAVGAPLNELRGSRTMCLAMTQTTGG